jgi:hypothetical protein
LGPPGPGSVVPDPSAPGTRPRGRPADAHPQQLRPPRLRPLGHHRVFHRATSSRGSPPRGRFTGIVWFTVAAASADQCRSTETVDITHARPAKCGTLRRSSYRSRTDRSPGSRKPRLGQVLPRRLGLRPIHVFHHVDPEGQRGSLGHHVIPHLCDFIRDAIVGVVESASPPSPSSGHACRRTSTTDSGDIGGRALGHLGN